MRIGIMGAGAIGMHLACQCFVSDIDVFLLCRTEEQRKQIIQEGILYEDYDGEKRQLFLPVCSDLKGEKPFDFLFVTLKQTHLEDALPQLQEISSICRSFVLFQNGLGHEEFFKRHFPSISLYFAVTTEGALRLSNTGVRQTGRGTTWVGRVGQIENRREAQTLIGLMRRTALNVEWEENILARIWKKLIANACINPLTAILNVHNGSLTISQATLNLMKEIFQEGKKVSERVGVHIAEEYFEDIVHVCKITFHNKSSMLQDVEAGRKTEIEFINGAIYRFGQQLGIETPTNRMIVYLLSAIEEFKKPGV